MAGSTLPGIMGRGSVDLSWDAPDRAPDCGLDWTMMAPISSGARPPKAPRRARPWRMVALIFVLVMATGAGAAWAPFFMRAW